jgi:ubiquinone/menaquinone biosynthesis C-methylase UbiE
MDAAHLEFADQAFDNILCIEAAPHFKTRRKFLQEAYRVLRPLGRLAMSDVLLHDGRILELYPGEWPKEIWPEENFLPNLESYRADLHNIGFRHVRIEDITEETVSGFSRYQIRKAEQEFDRNPDAKALEALMDRRWHQGWTWCMVYAIK